MNVEEVELLRVKIKNQIVKTSLIYVFIGCCVLLFGVYSCGLIQKDFHLPEEQTNFIFSIGGAIMLFGVFATTSKVRNPIKEFNLKYKSVIVFEIFKRLFTNIVYEPNSGIPFETISETNMIKLGNKYSSNDYLRAKYNRVDFSQADVHIEEVKTDRNGNYKYITLFQGRWMIFDFNKKFKTNIQLRGKNFNNSKRGDIFSGNNLKKIELEDMEFNNKFQTFAQNEVDAFYILTPSFMEKIKRLNESINASLLLCFINNKLHVAFNDNQDSFEHNIYEKIDIEKAESKILNEIIVITQFIDELNLSNDLFVERN